MAVKVVQNSPFDGPQLVEIIGQGVEIDLRETEKGEPLLYVNDVSGDTLAIFHYWSYAIVLDGIEALDLSNAERAQIAEQLESIQHYDRSGIVEEPDPAVDLNESGETTK